MKIGIIGTGWVGASVAISVLHDGTARELLLHDARGAVAEGEAMDLRHGAAFYPTAVGETTEAQWDELFASNAKAPYFLAQAAAPHLRAARGAIVNLVDIYVDRPLPRHPVYCMAKAALAMMTLALARELGPEVRVNAVAPGAVLWPESGKAYADQQELVGRTLLKRAGALEDVAGAVLYLMRDAGYVTGQTIKVDGGRSVAV